MNSRMVAIILLFEILISITRVYTNMQKYLFIPSMYGRLCKTEDLVFNVGGLSPVGCSAHCQVRDACIGVFHVGQEKTCLGCQKFYTDVCEMNVTIIYTRAYYESTAIYKHDENFGTHNMDSEGSGDCEATSTSSDVTSTTNDVTTDYYYDDDYYDYYDDGYY